MDDQLVDAFATAARVRRHQVFDDERLLPRTGLKDAEQAATGWVGPDYRPGGTIMIGINPGGGGDAYRGNAEDAKLYGLLRNLAAADNLQAKRGALRELSASWIAIQRTHNIWRLVSAIEQAVGVESSGLAFLNLLPFRTHNDKPARALELRRAWEVATQPQVEALAPKRILALGIKAHAGLLAAGADRTFKVVLLKRMIGDAAITAEAQAALAELRASRTKM